MRGPSELFAAAGHGDRSAKARLLSLIERGGDDAREVGRLAAPLCRQRLHGRDDRSARRRQEHADQRPDHPPARTRGGGRRARRRPVVAVHRRGDPRRPGAHAGPRHRRRGVHPLDGDTRPPRRAGAGHARGDPPARRPRAPLDPRRDGRRRPGRGRGRRQGRHDRRRRQPRVGRQRAGEQGRPDGGRRRVRDQQGRSGRCPGDPPRPPADARAVRRRCATGGADRGHDRIERRGCGPSCGTPSSATAPTPRRPACSNGAGASASARSCARSSPAGSSSGPASCAPASAGTP